jgi:hypothetical protein
MFTGSSATVADEKEHLSKVTGRSRDSVVTVSPKEDSEMELTGIVHHVIHRGVEGHNFMSNLTNLTSIVSHGRRRRREDEVLEPSASHKTLGFADSLQILGSWEYQVRDNEGLEFTKQMRGRANQVGRDASGLKPKEIPLPYRFNRPLFNLSSSGTEGVPGVDECEEHCRKCIAGERSSISIADGSQLNFIQLDYFRENKRAMISSPVPMNEGEVEIGVTDGCPYFRSGACWREEETFEPIPLFPEGPVVFKSSIHPIRLTADTIRNRQRQGSDSLELDHFSIDLPNYHSLRSSSRERFENTEKVAQIALSSPSIEVGMDFDNALDAVLFKAIRNTSAYRQKVGRLGRERFRDVYASMLTSFRAVDYHYYRNPSSLLNNNNLSTIPLATDNENVRRQTAFLAVFDDIAAFCESPGNELYSFSKNHCYKDVVESALKHLEGSSVEDRIHRSLEHDREICRDAVQNVREILNLLLKENSGLFEHGAECLADRIGRGSRGSSGGIVGPPTQAGMPRIHQLWLSEDGKRYTNLCKEIRKLANEVATCLEVGINLGGSLGLFFELGKEIWIKIEEGRRANEIGRWMDIFRDKERVTEMLLVANLQCKDHRISRVVTSAFSLVSSLDESSDIVKSRIDEGEVALGISLLDWNEQAGKFTGKEQGSLDWYFLRDLIGGLHITRHRHPYVFQKSLFESPNEAKTKLFVPNRGTDDSSGSSEEITIKEAIFGHGPGMFSYRRGESPMKTKCYHPLIRTPNYETMVLPLNDPPGSSTEEIKHKFTMEGELPDGQFPWALGKRFQGKQVSLFRPTQLNLWYNKGPDRGNKVILSRDGPFVADTDDCPEDKTRERDSEAEDDRNMPLNIPECFPIQWRSIEKHDPMPIQPFGGNLGKSFSDDPMKEILFKEVNFDRAITAKEFSLGLTRKYQGGDELTILYNSDKEVAESHGKPACMGYSFESKGVEFSLNDEAVSFVVEWTQSKIASDSGSSIRYQVLQHLLSDFFGETRFAIDSLLRLALHSNEMSVPGNLTEWLDLISGLNSTKMEVFSEAWGQTGSSHISIESVTAMVKKIEDYSLDGMDVDSLVEDWAIRTFANSIGIHLVQAGREFTGSREDDLGYHVIVDSKIASVDSGTRVWLYDRSPDGNGTCETISQWFSIPGEVRQIIEDSGNRMRVLPSKDFIQTLSDYLKPCDGHQANIVARGLNSIGKDTSELSHRLSRDVEFDYRNYSDDWNRIEEKYPDFGRNDFVFLNLMIPLLEEDEVESERSKKAASLCHTSCVQCLDEFGVSMLGPLDGPLYACKRMLDDVISEVMRKRPDDFRVSDLSIAGAALGISGIGNEDPGNPLVVADGEHAGTYYPMSHPERMWAQIDSEEPVNANGRLNVVSWTKMRHPRWE